MILSSESFGALRNPVDQRSATYGKPKNNSTVAAVHGSGSALSTLLFPMLYPMFKMYLRFYNVEDSVQHVQQTVLLAHGCQSHCHEEKFHRECTFTSTYHKVNNTPNRMVRFKLPCSASPLICFPTDLDGSLSPVIGTEDELQTILLLIVVATHDDGDKVDAKLIGLMFNALRGCATNAFVDDTTRRERNVVYFMVIDYGSVEVYSELIGIQ